MDCEEKENLIVVLLAVCGCLLVIVLAIVGFILRVKLLVFICDVYNVGKQFQARIKGSSRSQRREDATSVTSVEIQV